MSATSCRRRISFVVAVAFAASTVKLSLSEIQLALTQHTLDELLLRRLAKAVAQHVNRREKAANKTFSRSHRRSPAPPSAVGAAASSVGSRSRASGGITRRAGVGRSGGGDSEGQEDGGGLAGPISLTTRPLGGHWSSNGSVYDESSKTTLPVGGRTGARRPQCALRHPSQWTFCANCALAQACWITRARRFVRGSPYTSLPSSCTTIRVLLAARPGSYV